MLTFWGGRGKGCNCWCARCQVKRVNALRSRKSREHQGRRRSLSPAFYIAYALCCLANGGSLSYSRHLHHLLFLASLGGNVHFELLGIVILDLRHTAPDARSPDRVVIAAFLRDGPAVRACSPHEIVDGSAHRIDPDRLILLRMVVVPQEVDAGEWHSHHVAGILLPQIMAVQDQPLFAGANRFRRRLVRFHPSPGPGGPTALQFSQQFMRSARSSHLPVYLHHLLHFYFFVFMFRHDKSPFLTNCG